MQASPTYGTVIVRLSNEIDVLMKTFVYKGYQTLSHALAEPLGAACILYIVLVGYGILRGVIQTPMAEFMKGALRIGLIFMLAMNWATFSEYVVTFFVNGSSEIAAVMMKLIPSKIPGAQGGINSALQAVFTEVIRVGCWVWDSATFRHPGPYFTGTMILLSGTAVVGLALFELIAAKIMMGICLCTAPLFVMLVLFDKTRNFFDRWLGELVGFSLVLIFVSAVTGLCLHLLHWSVFSHYSDHAASFRTIDWIPILLCACFGVMALFEVVRMAKNIGGSCCTAGGSAMLGGFIGGSLGASGIARSAGNQLALAGRALIPASTSAKAAHMMQRIRERRPS